MNHTTLFMRRGFFFALLLSFATALYAQQSCSQRLNQAEDYFEQGRLLEIEALIRGCLNQEGGFTEPEKVRAYKLLVKVAIFTDNEPKAEEEFVNLLLVDPVHILQPEDPSELRVLRAKFRTAPVFRIEAKVGLNGSMPSVDQAFSTFPSNGEEKEYGFPSGIGFQIDVAATRHLKSGIEAGAGVQYRQSSYTVSADPSDVNDAGFGTEITNSQVALRFPVFVRYNLNYSYLGERPFTPYIMLGASLDYFLSAKYTQADRSGGTSVSLTGDDTDLKKFNQINDINASVFLGLGGKYTLKKGNFLLVEVRYDKALSLYNAPEQRYANARLHSDLQFVEDDLFLNFVSLNFGYVYSIFKPKKIEK